MPRLRFAAARGIVASMPRFIIHVGSAKTGTTAFQHWLRARREILPAHGYLFPAAGASRDGRHRHLAEALAGVAKPRTPKILKAFERECAAHPDADVILSTEYLTGADGLAIMPALGERIAALGYEPHAILVFRDQASFLNSVHAQQRKVIAPTCDFATYVTQRIHLGIGDWAKMADILTQAGFALDCLAYDADFRMRGSVAAICAAPVFRTSLPPPGDHHRANESFGEKALIVADRLHRAAERAAVTLKTPQRNRIRAMVTAAMPQIGADRPFNGLTLELAATIGAGYADSNARFARDTLGREGQELFDPVVVPDRPSPERLDDLPAAIARPLRLIARQIARECRKADWFRQNE